MSGFSIGSVALAGRAVLAPMAGVSDAAFRTLCLEQGAALVYTEMVSAKALCYNDKKTAALLHIPEAGRPAAAQIFGHEPESMAEGARRALEICRADIIDINMGCPVGKIVKSGDGSAIMRTPSLAGEIVSAVVRAVDVPVTVKIRKGWDSGSVNCVEVARICERVIWIEKGVQRMDGPAKEVREAYRAQYDPTPAQAQEKVVIRSFTLKRCSLPDASVTVDEVRGLSEIRWTPAPASHRSCR